MSNNKLLLIGIDNYLYLDKLNNCVKDLQDFRDVLLEKYDFDDANVTEIYNSSATNKFIQDAFIKLSSDIGFNDNLVVFFSGHGEYLEEQDRGFWIPVEGTHNYTSWIPNTTIIDHINKINCRHIFVISDSCFSNSLLIQQPAKGLKDYSRYRSRWAFTSAFRQAYDSAKGINGPFANAILDFLRSTGKDFRVGELIEHVKLIFSANELQSPQGSPLYCKNHSGGEMTFEIRQALDNRNLKGYNDFQKALKLYKRASEFKEIEIYEDKTKKIGFRLFQEFDAVFKKVTYYLYLYEGIALNQTYLYISGKHNQIFRDKDLIIFLPKERNQSDPSVRLNNVNSKFKPLNTFYIDDFIREQCTPVIDFDKSNFLSITNFIIPLGNGLGKRDLKDYVVQWFDEISKPILAISGTGGIGKTTFVQFVADLWIKKSGATNVIFIDSVQVKDVLMRGNKLGGILGLYSFYEAFLETSGAQSGRLNEELFKMNVDAGNILVVIDGLDEVISKVPNFKTDIFLKSINDASKELANGKVIITCRTHFWDTAAIGEVDLSVIELEPFNLEQARLFFEGSLDSNTKVKKALKLAEQFKYPGSGSYNENIFHPYVLDVIRSIIGSDKESLEIDLSQFASKILNASIKNDYIIFRVCDRERKRVGQISVDEQLKFFMFLAVEKRGIIKTDHFKMSIEEALNKKIDNTNVAAFKSHPFLTVGDYSTFKYDFLTDLFKGIYISTILDFNNAKSSLPYNFVSLIEENCWYGSAINTDIVSRVQNWTDYDILSISDVIRKISENQEIKNDKKQTSIANLFSLCLSINSRFIGDEIESNTKLLRALFETQKDQIENLCLINISVENNIRFDFSRLVLTNCYIKDYHSFWDCKFDNESKFINCYLLNLKGRTERQILSKVNFLDCVYDKETEDSLRKFEDNATGKIENAKSFLNDFFHLFFSSGRLGRQWEHKIIEPRFSGISQNRFNYNQTIKILKSHDILEITRERANTKMAISENHKEDVVRFIKDGTMSNHISRIIVDLSK